MSDTTNILHIYSQNVQKNYVLVDSAVICSFRAYLSSLIGMPLLVKAMVPEGTLVVISRVVLLTVQTLESMRTSHHL